MSNAVESVLARKIAASSRILAPTADLLAFADKTAKEFAHYLGELLDARLGEQHAADNAPFMDAVGRAEAGGLHFALSDRGGALAAQVIVSAPFADAVSARLLGADLEAPPEQAINPLLGARMAAPLVDLVIRAMNETISAMHPGAGAAVASQRALKTADQAMRNLEAAPVFTLAIDLSYGETTVKEAFRIILPHSFLERAGIGVARRSAPARSNEEKLDWAERLRRNILNTELPVDVTLARIDTNIGELSMLDVGRVFPLSDDALERLNLSAMTVTGRADIAHGRLGAFQNRKAVKLTTPIDPAFIGGL